jgi:hypothetical protein
MSSRFPRVTYAKVMATVAVVGALGAGSVAAGAIGAGSPVIRACANKRTGALRLLGTRGKCSKSERSVAWNQTGPQGAPGNDGTNGTNGANGTNGTNGMNGSAVAYAHVLSNGALDTANSKNVAATGKPGATGLVCLRVSVPVSTMTATVDAGNSAGGGGGSASGALAGQDPSSFLTTDCPAGSWQALVATANTSGANADLAFWVTFN